MALRTAAMNPAEVTPRIRKPNHFFRKLVLLLLLIAAYALGLVLLSINTTWFPLILFSYMADGTLGVVAGFSTRLLLSKRHWLIRSITTTVQPIVGLAILGYFTDWRIGLNIVELSRGFVSWTDLIHFVVGITASWAALWAWYRPATTDVEDSSNGEVVRSAVVVQPGRTGQSRSWSLRSRLKLNQGSVIHSESGSRSSVRSRLKFVTKQPTRPKRRKSSLVHRPHIQLAVVEEHRCPYCLEPVNRSDPGGVIECEVCHTLHHADCWAITGVCQVPHLNT